jgi:hypothetical protein
MLRIGAVALGFLAAAVGLSSRLEAREATAGDWVGYRNERFGFRLEYPANVFRIERTSEAGDGRVFAARDGEARLLVGAFANEDKHSPTSYQDFLARNSYADYKISYRPFGDNWLVLSGEGDGRTFYEKVVFSCGGQLISSFALIYPSDQRGVFDPIVARVANSFVPGKTTPCKEADSASRVRHRAAAEPGPPLDEPPPRNGWHARTADRIARQRGTDVIVILRRTSPPYDYKYVRGYATR